VKVSVEIGKGEKQIIRGEKKEQKKRKKNISSGYMSDGLKYNYAKRAIQLDYSVASVILICLT